ncbi:MAG: AAA family ATPase [Fervidobacterium sp.]
MKKLPKGINDYKRIIIEKNIYVDKTKYIYELVNNEKVAFLSRPRRFGKSLLLSTLYYLFKGEKELFEGTWIYDKWEWQEYPVVHISFTSGFFKTTEDLEGIILDILQDVGKEYDITLREGNVARKFRGLLIDLYEKYNKPIVILIDEYEKPVLDNITNPEKAKEMRELLRGFYSVLKDYTGMIRFLLITGLTKFTKMGVFSALNNLTDISFKPEYSQMLGYTHEEVIQYFDEYIQKYLQLTGLSKEEFLEMFKEYYDGYSFDGIWYDEEGKDRRVYNPYAVLLFFDNMRFAPYWSDSGAPSFVYEYLKEHNVSKDELLNQKVSESDFSQWEIEDNPPHLFLTQAGYLTQRLLTTRTSLQPIYELSIPNIDARLGIEKLLFSTEQKIDLATVSSKVNALAYAIETRDIKEMINTINSIYAKVSSRARKQIEKSGKEDKLTHLEVFYQSIMVSLFESTGVNVVSEEESSGGRADVVVKYNGLVYVIELKVDKSAKEALEQIKTKGYHEPYKGKEVYLIGVNISSETGSISDWVYEKI